MNNTNVYLTWTELLSRSLQEIRERFAPFFLLACAAPAFNWLLMGVCFGFNPLTQSAARQQSPFLFICLSLISALIGIWFFAALILYICKREQTIKASLKSALPLLPRLIGASLLIGLVLTVVLTVLYLAAMLLFYVAGAQEISAYMAAFVLAMAVFGVLSLIVGVYLCLLPYKLILSEETIFSAIKTSYLLVKGMFWKTAGVLLILTLIALLISSVAGLVLGFLTFALALLLPFASGILTFLWVPVSGVLALAFQVPLVALYIDRNSVRQNAIEQQTGNTSSLELGKEQ